MKNFVSNLLSSKLVEAKDELDSRIKNLVNEKINQVKLRLCAEMSKKFGIDIVSEGNVLRMGRTKLVKLRIRRGKIQRRKKFSAVKGYTIRDGKMTRMMPAERMHRRIAARRAKIKRRAKLNVALRKRRMSYRKRRALGLQ